MLGPRSIRSTRCNIVKCTGCKKTIKSEICRIPTKYQKILHIIQSLRPDATMESLFCFNCYTKILSRWEESKKKRLVNSKLSTVDSSSIISSNIGSAGSQDSFDKLVSLRAQTPNWRTNEINLLQKKQLTPSSDDSSFNDFGGSSEEPCKMVQNDNVSSTENHPVSKPPSPTVSPLASPRSSLASPRRLLASPRRSLASPRRSLASPRNSLASPRSSLALSRSSLERYEQFIEIPTEIVETESPEEEVQVRNKRPHEEQPVLIDSLSESESDYAPRLRKKPRVRIRKRNDGPPDPNIDINFHERFNGG